MSAHKSTEKTKEWMELLRPYLSEHRTMAHKFSPKASALLVIDMQRYFLERESHAFLPDSELILGNVESLVAEYRAKSLPIIFTRHAVLPNEEAGAMGRWWGDRIRNEDPMSEIVPSLKPKNAETVLRKSKYNAFAGTDLEARLERLGVKQLMITGVMTHLCCETTARDAFTRDFDVFVVIDGMASSSEDLHVSSLKTLVDGFAIPVTTEEALRWLK
jgi:bifunctional isochorismate lyase/aryl carrier protein